MIIGVTGTNGAGKDTVAEYLIGRGFNHYSLSDEIREIMADMGVEESRENLIRIGNRIRMEKGPSHLAERVTKKLKRPAVVTSIRNIYEVKHLKNQESFVFIHVDADREVRFSRSRSRNRTGDSVTLEEFIEKEEIELRGSVNEQNLLLCFQEADHVIYNNTGTDELYASIDGIIEKLKNRGV